MIKVLVNNSPTKVRVFFVTAKHSHIFFRNLFLQGSPALRRSLDVARDDKRGRGIEMTGRESSCQVPVPCQGEGD